MTERGGGQHVEPGPLSVRARPRRKHSRRNLQRASGGRLACVEISGDDDFLLLSAADPREHPVLCCATVGSGRSARVGSWRDGDLMEDSS